MVSATEEECEASGVSEPGEERVVDVFGEAKKEEIIAWLQRARSKHSQERIIYERFTVRGGRETKADVVLGFCLQLLNVHRFSVFCDFQPTSNQPVGLGFPHDTGVVSARGIAAFVSGLLNL